MEQRCSVCDSQDFPSLLSLKEHKESLAHWSSSDDEEQEEGDDEPQTNNGSENHRQQCLQSACDELERLL